MWFTDEILKTAKEDCLFSTHKRQKIAVRRKLPIIGRRYLLNLLQ